jgi:hypothetical protein
VSRADTDLGTVSESDGDTDENRSENPNTAGVDYAWVMQTTFVLTVVVGAPAVAVLSVFRPLPSWEARVGFAVRVGAVVWILTALLVFASARRRDASGNNEDSQGRR